jgi:hypothetical protein
VHELWRRDKISKSSSPHKIGEKSACARCTEHTYLDGLRIIVPMCALFYVSRVYSTPINSAMGRALFVPLLISPMGLHRVQKTRTRVQQKSGSHYMSALCAQFLKSFLFYLYSIAATSTRVVFFLAHLR